MSATRPRRLTLHAEGVVVLGQPDLRRASTSIARGCRNFLAQISRVLAFDFAEGNRRLPEERRDAGGGRGRPMLTTKIFISLIFKMPNSLRTCSLMWRTEWRMSWAFVSKVSSQTLQR